MIKRTLYFGTPAYLRKKNNQLEIKKPEDQAVDKELSKIVSVPIEDIGIIILDNGQITLSHGLLSALIENNVAVVTCNSKHHPTGLFLNLDSNHTQSEKFQDQIEVSIPLKKQLWQQTISTKIRNQTALLKKRNIPITNMLHWAKKVRSGDPDNYEGRAAAYYWKNIFPKMLEFTRDRYGLAPNQLLNYGYAILRATVARSLVGSGLLPTLGIHHHNKYNAYCLADDIMEPYRPFVDEIVCTIVENGEDFYELSKSIKEQLLEVPTVDVYIEDKRSPLLVGVQRTTASLAKCYAGEMRKILYPEI
ncbi:MAG: type II CRISPR-associated endonuclease Cas1 [Ignavibacteriae bacterium]|nr:type II CRISPR-associated endonuclease Cas1 [Ignavibacteriota bacterium]